MNHGGLGWVYLAPTLDLSGFVLSHPENRPYQLFRWDGFSEEPGLYRAGELPQSAGRWTLQALSHNPIFIAFYSILPILIGLILASLLGRRPIRGLTIYRAGLFLPQVLSMVVVGVIWRWIFNPAFGPLNIFLRSVGLESWAKPWLGDFTQAASVGLIGTWVQYGFCMVLFLGGIQRLPPDFYEASELDGANEMQQFLYITLPSLRSEIGVALITTTTALASSTWCS